MKCMIIDDEPAARSVLEHYIGQVPDLTHTGSCINALDALDKLRNETADLLFLDINMPGLSGIELLKSMNRQPLVIFTTAYSEYALEGFELNAVDYLLKPIAFDRFLKAVDKARSRTGSREESDPEIISVKADGKWYRIPEEEILYAESNGDYVSLHTAGKKLTFYETLKSFQSRLSPEHFMRIHRSYLVNLHHVQYLEGNRLNVDGRMLPVGATWREDVKSRFSDKA